MIVSIQFEELSGNILAAPTWGRSEGVVHVAEGDCVAFSLVVGWLIVINTELSAEFDIEIPKMARSQCWKQLQLSLRDMIQSTAQAS